MNKDSDKIIVRPDKKKLTCFEKVFARVGIVQLNLGVGDFFLNRLRITLFKKKICENYN